MAFNRFLPSVSKVISGTSVFNLLIRFPSTVGEDILFSFSYLYQFEHRRKYVRSRLVVNYFVFGRNVCKLNWISRALTYFSGSIL